MKKALTLIILLQTCLLMAQSWEQMSSVPDNFRTDHSFGFAIDEVGYLVTGNNSSGATSDFYTYNAETDVWTKKADFPGLARGFAIGDVIDGKAYFGFGYTGNVALNDLWVYDPVDDSWTELESCECSPRLHPAMVALDGFIYVGLGNGSAGNMNDWWAYDIANNSWENRSDFPDLERHHPFQFTDGEYVYVGNGHGNNNAIFNEWYRYDTAQDTWMQVATMPAEGRVAGTQLSHRGNGYVLSGDGDDHSFMDTGELWKYDSTIDMWTELPPHPGRSVWAPASFIINNEIYIINGLDRVDGYTDKVYKLGLDVFEQPRLRLSLPDLELLDYQYDGNSCNALATTELVVSTPLAFDSDASITLSIDPTSTAVEGQDFVLNDKTGVLPTGELATTFGITIFNDAIASGDKTVIFNMTSDQVVETPQRSMLIMEDDIPFDTSVQLGSANIGSANTTNANVFGQYYTNMRTQMIYRNDMLSESGLTAGDINKITFNVEQKASLNPYLDFTVYMTHTNVSALNGGIDFTLNFQEVYRGTLVTTEGRNEITFDTPFAYNGSSNIAIQFCFDNNAFTNDDLVSAFDTDYVSSATLKVDNVTGCVNAGNRFDEMTLPVITFGEGQPSNLYASIDRELSSSIGSNETIYLEQRDSILMSIKAETGSALECMSASLLSNTNEIITDSGLMWQDKVYYLEQEGESTNDYTFTLILPNTGAMDWSAADLTGLYTDQKIAAGDLPAWETVEITDVIVNEPYVFVSMASNGNGSYTVGMVDDMTSDINDLDVNFTFDAIEYHDVLGRRILLDETMSSDRSIGLYIKSYLYEGKIVKTEKVVR